MGKLQDALRQVWTQEIENYFTAKGEEVLHEKDNIVWIPTVDSEGNDTWIKISVQVPSKVEEDDDGYAKDTAYHAHKAEKLEKEKLAAEKKAKKIAADAAKRAAKQKDA